MKASIIPGNLSSEPFYAEMHVTSFYDLAIKKWRLDYLEDDGVSGPFVFLNAETALFISRCGMMSLVKIEGDSIKLLAKRMLPFAEREIFCGPSEEQKFGGVKGLYYIPERQQMFISHHSEVSKGCIGLRISEFNFDFKELEVKRRKVIFDSKPCRPKDAVVYTAAGGVFTYDRNLGKVFFSVGDFGDNLNASDLRRSYGSIWAYDLKAEESSRWAVGSRNAQGLDIGQKSVLFGAEHGPKGGDEINVINYGDDLGWPHSSYGIDYGFVAKPGRKNDFLGNHDLGKKPDYVFFPSMGISGLRAYPINSYFLEWGGDLILASLKGNTIYRLKTDGAHVVYAEPLANVAERIRSVVISSAGQVFFKADPNIFIKMELASDAHFDLSRMGASTAESCRICHNSRAKGVPQIYGKTKGFIISELNKFASGERPSESMSNVARGLNDLKKEAVAIYFSSKGKPFE